MSISQLIPPYPHTTTLLLPSSSCSSQIISNFNFQLRIHHNNLNLDHNQFLSPLHRWRKNTISPCSCASASDSAADSSDSSAVENGDENQNQNQNEDGGLELEERELREVVEEILEEAGVSRAECVEIGSNSPKYAKMLRDSVRELDELSLWSSWMKDKGEEIRVMTFKEKAKRIAMEKGDNGKIPYLESVGLSLSSATRLARLLSSDSLPSLICKVNYVKEIFFCGSGEERLAGKLAHRMMANLSIFVDEDVQQTLSFFEKIEARRGGLDMLGSADTSFRHLIESFPRLLLLSVESDMRPMVQFLENIGVPSQRMGDILLRFPPLLSLDIKDIKARLRSFEKIGAREKDVGRILVKYPWVLSKSILRNYEEIFSFLDDEKVQKASIDRAIIDWPLLLGCSVDNLKPMVEEFDVLGVRTTKLGKVLTTSPQLLLLRPKEFQKVLLFLQDLGLDKESIVKILVRCPEFFASSTEETLQKKIEFLTHLGIQKQQIPRIINKYPEFFVLDVDKSVRPRLRYLMESGLSKREIASMVTRFSPLLGYSVENILRPKLEFLVNTMGKPVKDVVEYPRYFSYSLEKKIKPRFFVASSRNINFTLKDLLAKNDEEFASDFLGV